MSDALPQLTAALEGRYVPERELGAGGMATVYLAHDVRHDRQVALKVLRPELAAVIGGERFLAEIKTTANLQHPHILPLFDSGTVEGTVFYVMPYVEGESLRDRLQRERQLPLADALRITREVASALDYAHRQGVIHRDIKPENILLHDGSALVADFGIALAVSRSEGGARMTETGLSLGTPFYMSPEQAMGERTLDARADIYALGCVLYEMLTGDPPFSASSAQAVVAKVLTEKPTPIRSVRDTVPEGVESAVLTALAKLPADRFATSAEFSDALAAPTAPRARSTSEARAGVDEATARNPGRLALPWIAAVAVLAAVAGWALRSVTLSSPAPAEPIRFAFKLADPASSEPFVALSPDGRRVLQSVTDSAGVLHVVARDLGSTGLVSVQGTEGAMEATYSVDGRWIYFRRGPELWRVPAEGGPATQVTEGVNDIGEGWMPDGSILVTKVSGSIWQLPADGGAAVQVTQLDTVRKEFAHWSPTVLPGGHAFVFAAYATPVARSRIQAYDFDSGEVITLVEGGISPRYVDGKLFFCREGAIWAVAFDPEELRVSGTPVPVQDDVAWKPSDGIAGYDIAPDGTMAFIRASEWDQVSRVVWVDRSGRETPALPDAGAYQEPRLSPDGRWIAVTVTKGKTDLWLYEIGRGVLTQLTHAPGSAFAAAWTPDSRSLVYVFEDPVYDIHRLTIDDSEPDREVLATPRDKMVFDVTPDGRAVLYGEQGQLSFKALSDTTAPRTLGAGDAVRGNAAVSPDGRWIAYEEWSGSQSLVYLAAADGTGGRRVVSAGGGTDPRWTKGGREIVYRHGDDMMAAPVSPTPGTVGSPVRLFRKRIQSGQGGDTPAYDVTPDGSRFLMAVPVPRPEARPVEVVLNWVANLDGKTKAGG
jgi:serine/threonine-protein kinase